MKKFTLAFSLCLALSGMLFISCQKKEPPKPSETPHDTCHPCHPKGPGHPDDHTPPPPPNKGSCKKY